jgi:hypothetical protein
MFGASEKESHSFLLSLFESQQLQTAQIGHGAMLCNIESKREREMGGWVGWKREREYRVGVSEDCS